MPIGPEDAGSQYKLVRGLVRGLRVLRALNQAPGAAASISELAQRCGMHRTTVKRLLETLREEGLVRQDAREGRYGLTSDVRGLSEGFADEPWVQQVAAPLMREAVRRLVWPSDLATPDAGYMVVRESTHRLSALSQHRTTLGERLPLLVTAAGRAYLAACSPAQQDALIEVLRRREDRWSALARDPDTVARLIAQTRQRGYAYNDGEWTRESAFAAVAVPVRAGRRVLAAINLVFPRSAVTQDDLQARYVPDLLRLARAIGRGAATLSERGNAANGRAQRA